MGRKVLVERITLPGRDKDKVFVITEMGATRGKKWLMDIYATAKTGDNKEVLALLDKPEFSAWRDCVKYRHAPNHPDQPIMWDDDVTCQVEEIATVGFLQGKVLEMHTSFFPDVSP